MTTKVCIYTRFSTIMQVDGLSLIGQEEYIRKYCASHNMEIVATYSDKGKSGKALAEREDFQKMITTIMRSLAEMGFENIHTQTMLGRQQKARDGLWNGGFAPYGYR